MEGRATARRGTPDLQDCDIRDLCDIATRQRRALERVLAGHESMGVHAPQWCAGCSAGKGMSEWVVWPCPVVVYIAAILEGKP